MDTCKREVFYYVSNIITGTITIIDGSCNSIVKDIFVGKRPFNMAAVNNKLYIACDRSGKVAVMDCISQAVGWINIPNNGNIEADEINNKIYVADATEISIYDINTGRIITSIKGLQAIVCIRLSADKSRLYVLDKLNCELRIYNTKDFSLVYHIKNIGVSPEYFLVSQDDEAIYISFGSSESGMEKSHILKADINKKSLEKIYLEKGSLITGMALNGTTLYAANRAMNRVDLIDTRELNTCGYIYTTLPEPTSLIITGDRTKLLVVNRNLGEAGGIDIIDTANNNCIIGTVLMHKKNTYPYNIAAMAYTAAHIEDSEDEPKRLYAINENGEAQRVVSQKLLSVQCNKMEFPKITIRIDNETGYSYIFEQIKFKNGCVVSGSESIKPIEENEEYIEVSLSVRIKYIFYYMTQNEIRHSYEGFLEKPITITLKKQTEDISQIQFAVETACKVNNIPRFIKDIVTFNVSAFIEIRVLKEAVRTVPSFDCCWEFLEEKCLNCLGKSNKQHNCKLYRKQ